MIKYCFLIGFVFMLSSCHNINGSGNIISKDRTVDNFTSVKVNNGIRMNITAGEKLKVNVEADDNIIDDVETKVVGEELVVRFSDNFSFQNTDIIVNVVMPLVKRISASGGSTINSENQLPKTDAMSIKASGGASVNASVDARTLDLESSGGAALKIIGRSQLVSIDASGGATVNTYELLAETSNIKASGGASVKTYASVNVDAGASSGASISYKGNPSGNIKKNESSGGSVNNKD